MHDFLISIKSIESYSTSATTQDDEDTTLVVWLIERSTTMVSTSLLYEVLWQEREIDREMNEKYDLISLQVQNTSRDVIHTALGESVVNQTLCKIHLLPTIQSKKARVCISQDSPKFRIRDAASDAIRD